MTLADFFLAVNAAGIRLANVSGQLQLLGPANEINEEIKAGAAEHTTAVLALLPPGPPPGAPLPEITITAPCLEDLGKGAEVPTELLADQQAREPASIVDAQDEASLSLTERPCQEPDRAVLSEGFRHRHDWQDWRLEWLLEVGTLYLRMRGCQDAEVLARLRPLAEATPTSVAEWLALGQKIANTEHELKQQGRLPPYPWPERS
jgi:hypothetical protein